MESKGTRTVRESRMQFAGHQFADYGLLLRGRPTTVVEAKKTGRDAQVGQEQALQYAQGLRTIHGGPTPFVMYTNGYDFFFWDSDEYPPSKVAGFPTPEDVDWLAQRRETKGALSIELINNVIAGRDY